MGNSIQEQLLKAGLVSEEQLRNASKPPRQARHDGSKGTTRRRKRGSSVRPNATQRAATTKPSRQTPPPSLEELNARIRKLLEAHRENTEAAEVPYNFTRENRIKKLYVTEEQRQKLLAGDLVIAGYRRVHHIIPANVGEQIQGLREEIFVHRADPNSESQIQSQEPQSEGDQADKHIVPDDLIW